MAEEPTAQPTIEEEADNEILEDEMLIEEISIDGMCGVY
jgi:mycofactocin precursor